MPPPTRETHLHVASGPRHVLLMAGLAAARPGPRHVLVHLDHYRPRDARRLLDGLAAWSDNPFERVVELPTDYRPRLGDARGVRREVRRYLLRRELQRANARVVGDLVRDLRPRRVHVSTDGTFEAHLALYLARRADPGCRGVYVEEGTSAYDHTFCDGGLERRLWRPLRNASKRLTHGAWWRPGPAPGTSPYIDESLAAFPDLVIEELRRGAVAPLPREAYLTPGFRALNLDLARRMGADLDGLRVADLVVVLTTSRVARDMPGYAESMREICVRLAARGRTVLVKVHPRERDPGFVGLPIDPHLVAVPPELPFESLLVLNENPGLTVVGDVSTALLATRWLRPEARTLALRYGAPGSRVHDYLRATFDALDIGTERDPRRLVAALDD